MTPAAAPAATSAGTIPELFQATAEARGDRPGLGSIAGGVLQWHSWNDLRQAVGHAAAALAALGVRPGDRVAQIGANSRPWILADLAIQSLGAVHVPLHAAIADQQAAELIAHCGAVVILADDRERLDRLRSLLPAAVQGCLSSELPDPTGAAAPPVHPGRPDDLATLLYTSGTTGPPRGVMLTHSNLVTNAIAVTHAARATAEELRLCILPLSHIYARTCDLYSWLVTGARLVLAETRETIFRDCQTVAPNALNAVPYFYQKIVDRLRDSGAEIDGAALRSALGGQIQRCYCGGAPLAPEVDRYFAERGLPVHVGYGLTESSPVICATSPGDYVSGTVGPPIEDVEVRIAEDGEIQCRGPNVMLGYWQNEAATAQALQDGWLCTGDLGQLDPGGHLRIIGRKKEMIVLATGKKVAPTLVENRLTGSPWIEQACVVGEGRKCLAALIVPTADALRNEVARHGLTPQQVQDFYREEIDRCLADLAQFEQVGRFLLLDRTFTLDRGEVTPKLSLCRQVIQKSFAEEIDAMYRE